jgi:hypothetical protein
MSHWVRIFALLVLFSVPLFAQDSEETSEAGNVTATEDQWQGFRYEDHGLTQWEFQQAKEAGLTRDKLLSLLELGIRPNEYTQKPWVALNVTEEEWLKEREQGMEDSDIDRTYRIRAGNQSLAYWSLLAPSLYQWNVSETTKAISMDIAWAGAVGATVFLAATSENSEWIYGAILVAGVHAWSFLDAFMSTQWENNPDANRFSWGITPTYHKGVAGLALFRF